MRYNMYRCSQINAAVSPGYSTGQAMRAMEEVFAETMPNGMGFDYLGMSFQEQKAAQGVPAERHIRTLPALRLPDSGGAV